MLSELRLRYSVDTYPSEDHRKYHYIQARLGGRIIGGLYCEFETGRIVNIWVAPEYRRRGVGRWMYQGASEYFEVFHDVDKHCTPEGLAFKRAVGGEEVDPDWAFDPYS